MDRFLARILEAASAALLLLLTLTALFELAAWTLFSRSIPAVEELQAVLMVWFGMLSAAYCLGQGLHLAVDVVTRTCGPRLRRGVALAARLAVTAFGLLLAVSGWRLVSVVDNTLPGTGWSAALQYQPVAAAGLLIAALALLGAGAPAAGRERRTETSSS